MRKIDIYFAGQVAPGLTPEQVKPNLAKLLKASPAQVEKLFCGKAIRIKAAVDEETAVKYRAALQKVGAVAVLREAKAPDAAPVAAQPVAKPAAPAPRQPQPAASPPKAEAPPVPSPEGRASFGEQPSLASANRASFGVEEDEPEPPGPEAPNWSTEGNYSSLDQLPDERAASYAPPTSDSGLTAAPANSGSLEEFAEEEVPVPIPDTSHLPLAARGASLDQTEEEAPVEFDLSGLSALPANTGSLEDCVDETPPLPIPDTSDLNLAD